MTRVFNATVLVTVTVTLRVRWPAEIPFDGETGPSGQAGRDPDGVAADRAACGGEQEEPTEQPSP